MKILDLLIFNKRQPIDPLSIPLTIKALDEEVTLKLSVLKNNVFDGLQYRLSDKDGWLPYEIDFEITLRKNSYVQFQNINNTLSTSSDKIFLQNSGLVEISGNMQSMVNYIEEAPTCCFYSFFNQDYNTLGGNVTGCVSLPATTLGESCYSNMFVKTLITEMPELPATTVPRNCYNSMFASCSELRIVKPLPATFVDYSGYVAMFKASGITETPEIFAEEVGQYGFRQMFLNCINLILAKDLHVTTIGKKGCEAMFNNCSKLKTAPTLPATTMTEYCYTNMFKNCSSLETTPLLPATTLYKGCYEYMFYNCSNLSVVKTAASTIGTSYCGDWLSGVKSTGTFYCSTDLEIHYGTSFVPEGWEVKNINEIL